MCSYELVARADSDDLSEPTRFARLIPALVQGGYTVLGSAMLEVNESNTAVESTREAIVDSERLLRAMDSRTDLSPVGGVREERRAAAGRLRVCARR